MPSACTSSLQKVETRITFVSFPSSFSRRSTLRPSIAGSTASMMAKSGFLECISSSASVPFPTHPITVNSSVLSNASRSIVRNSPLGSASKTVFFFSIAHFSSLL